MKKSYLMIPGPTIVPPEVYRAMQTPMFGHRSKDYFDLHAEAEGRLKQIFQTGNDLFILASSGTGAMESAIVNLLAPGDRILVTCMGDFGIRFADIAESHGCTVDRLEVDYGNVVHPDVIRERLEADTGREIKAVITTHNETSTGATLDLAAVGAIVKEYPAVLVTDAVSSMAAIDLQTDNWFVDVVITGSQKALMSPPGLAFVSVSPKAWQLIEANPRPRYYFDYRKYKKSAAKSQTPFTPAITTLLGVNEAARMILGEGLQNVFRRHLLMRDMIRAGVRAIGLDLVAADEWASASVTAVKVPEGIDVGKLRSRIRSEHGVAFASGRGPLADSSFRIGHMGYVVPLDMLQMLAVVEWALEESGHSFERGASIAAAEQVMRNRLRLNRNG